MLKAGPTGKSCLGKGNSDTHFDAIDRFKLGLRLCVSNWAEHELHINLTENFSSTNNPKRQLNKSLKATTEKTERVLSQEPDTHPASSSLGRTVSW